MKRYKLNRKSHRPRKQGSGFLLSSETIERIKTLRLSGQYTLVKIGEMTGLHFSTVDRVLKRIEKQENEKEFFDVDDYSKRVYTI